MRKVRPAEVRSSPDGCQHVIDEGKMKHLLGRDIRYDSFPLCNRFQLAASQSLACPAFKTESCEEIFAHYHMLQRGRFRENEDEIFAISYSNRIARIIPLPQRSRCLISRQELDNWHYLRPQWPRFQASAW